MANDNQTGLPEKNESVGRSSLAYTLTSIALFDAFICSWYEKYKTDLIRPITVINDRIDKNWQPYIQTPPFPEFTSGHAVISNAAATVLTALFGSDFAFTDKTEIPFGNTSRSFKSFYEASDEVTWSRVYGGIHYPATARISIVQGREIGNHVLTTLYPAALK
ncbi:MAG: vanadium-dependent haloperoxidase [Chitinophagaceae bacterium]|nr:vanadium-dependent haloperoxidase [Chitinophagaceae bacterium]